jgi:ABC-type nickel/cobalt efflux system permease component RcnA
MVELIAGLIAGALHVWSGPDHLAAIAPLAIRNGKRSWAIGVRWGIGHSLGVIAVALVALWLRDLVPPELLSDWGERLVGILLVGIGLWGLRTAYRSHVHAHRHRHDGEEHTHIHAHAHGHSPERAPPRHVHFHAAMGIGVLHGIAGGSHFLGVLPALAFPTGAQATLYLAAFAFGTIVSMATFGALVDWLARRSGAAGANGYRLLLTAASTAATAVGCYWLATA